MKKLCTRFTLLATLAGAAILLAAPGAGASGGGGAGVRGSGDEVISSILAATGNGHVRRSSNGRAPSCHRRILTDAQVLYLVHVKASRPELLASGFGEAIDDYLASEVLELPAPTTTTTTTLLPATGGATDPATESEAPVDQRVDAAPRVATTEPEVVSRRVFGDATVRNFRLSVRICNGVADSMEVTSETVSNDSARSATVVRDIAVLTAPTVHVAPSREALVGEPVFIDVQEPAFEGTSISLGGFTVEVSATPTSLTLFDGQYADDVGRTIDCGFGSGFDPESADSPEQQALAAEACVFHYDRTTGAAPGRPDRRDSWIGYAKVDWDVSYAITRGGVETESGEIDSLFSYSLFDVSVGEIESVLEG